MDPLSLSEIASMAGALLTNGDPSVNVSRISKDTRDIRPGDLYVALRGERFDGNAFLAEAAAKGAVAALCDAEPPVGLPSHFGILSASDGLAGLTLLAAAWRERLKLRSVVITGSSGKTSTKDFTAAVLAARLRVTATRGNLNNHIGLPLSILSASSSDEAAIWEIGMNHRGEIAPLAGLARPEIGIITGIGSAHIEHLGSREEIAREKGDLLERIQPNGRAILPAADDFITELRSRTSAQVIEVGIGIGDLRAVNLRTEGSGTRFEIEGVFGKTEAFLPVPGRHMVGNALLAIAAGVFYDIPLGECSIALGSVALTGGRLGILERNGATILDDTYNANPESMIAAHASSSEQTIEAVWPGTPTWASTVPHTCSPMVARGLYSLPTASWLCISSRPPMPSPVSFVSPMQSVKLSIFKSSRKASSPSSVVLPLPMPMIPSNGEAWKPLRASSEMSARLTISPS